ncbi:hypothetical protein IKF84_01470 [Candidatus Saccharibacteria bacterium]|nr:hypothetical protein [Candidatus Saccharibacteria bacterium]
MGPIVLRTQSICPKGWTLPGKVQLDSIGGDEPSTTYVSSFSPVLGGFYYGDALRNESTYGRWWGSTVHNSALRYSLHYNSSSFLTYGGNRFNGLYIRCIQAS